MEEKFLMKIKVFIFEKNNKNLVKVSADFLKVSF